MAILQKQQYSWSVLGDGTAVTVYFPLAAPAFQVLSYSLTGAPAGVSLSSVTLVSSEVVEVVFNSAPPSGVSNAFSVNVVVGF